MELNKFGVNVVTVQPGDFSKVNSFCSIVPYSTVQTVQYSQ